MPEDSQSNQSGSNEPVPPFKVPPATTNEQVRQLAELLSDLHEMLGVIDANRYELIPGESQATFHQSWVETSAKLQQLTVEVSNNAAQGMTTPYVDHQLTGPSGTLKRSFWCRAWDEVRSVLFAQPRTDELRQRIQKATGRALEVTCTVIESIGSAYSKPVIEFLAGAKHLLDLRAEQDQQRRGGFQ